MEGWKIHWKAPLQPKGFIKFIEMFVALLALSLVAGFVAKQNAGCRITGANSTELVVNFTISVPYAFSTAHYELTPIQDRTDIDPIPQPVVPDNKEITDKGFMHSAQFFVTWGSFTLFYGVIALAVYMLTTANENMERLVNYLVITDLVFHVVWVICWFIASVEWAVAQNGLRHYLNDTLAYDQFQELNCTDNFSSHSDSFVQAAIGDVFGFASIILWLCNIYFVFVDTTFYLQWRSSQLGDYGAIDP